MAVKVVAGVAPNETPVAPDRPAPTMVTEVPPAGTPLLGLTEVTSTVEKAACTVAQPPDAVTHAGVEAAFGTSPCHSLP